MHSRFYEINVLYFVIDFWDLLLESRIKLQNALNTVNQFPQYEYFDQLIKNLSDDFEKNTQSISEESKSNLILKPLKVS